jgi:hypothetical protein
VLSVAAATFATATFTTADVKHKQQSTIMQVPVIALRRVTFKKTFKKKVEMLLI